MNYVCVKQPAFSLQTILQMKTASQINNCEGYIFNNLFKSWGTSIEYFPNVKQASSVSLRQYMSGVTGDNINTKSVKRHILREYSDILPTNKIGSGTISSYYEFVPNIDGKTILNQ